MFFAQGGVVLSRDCSMHLFAHASRGRLLGERDGRTQSVRASEP